MKSSSFKSLRPFPLFWVRLQPDLLKSPTLHTVQHLLDHVLNLLEKTTVQENSSLFQLLEQKTQVLIALHSGDPLPPSDQEFYNWSLKLLDETNKVRTYVQGKLLKVIHSHSSTTISNTLPTLEQKYQEAKSYETDEGKPKNLAKAFQLYEELMQADYVPAIVKAAFCLYHGMGTLIDIPRAARLAKDALTKNLTPLQKGQTLCILGILLEEGYFEGDVWTKDIKQAEKFLQESDHLGDLFGGVFLARFYFGQNENLKGEPLIKIKLPQLIQQAEKGYPLAQARLGICYGNGQGVKQDAAQAAFWYQKAADQGHANAQCNLGFCYEKGEGVKPDAVQAASWYQKAADQGPPLTLKKD